MEQTKQDLTLLIARISESFPDDNDLKGFLGISKALITDTLIQGDALLILLKEHDSAFEVIILKRELAELFEKINRDLDEKFDKIKPDKFQSLLKQITKIKFRIKETYISVAGDSVIRTEAEIARAHAELQLLSSNNEELKRIHGELLILKNTTIQTISNLTSEATIAKESTVAISNDVIGLKENATVIVADFEAKQKTSVENEKTISEFLTSIVAHNAAIEKIQERTTTWEEEIETANEQITSKGVEFETLNKKSKALQLEIELTHDKIFGKTDKEGRQAKGYLQETEDLKVRIANFLTEQETKFTTQFKEIEGLLPGATSAGLAEAYQQQKDSYKWPVIVWSAIFGLAISAMTFFSAYILYDQLSNNPNTVPSLTDALISLLKELPFFIPTIWLASYASKQQSQYKRLQQEYAFKETNAKSFHGHKMQIEELMVQGTDNSLLEQLVAQLVVITSYNPSATLDNRAHEDSSPILKFVEKYLPKKSKETIKEE